jgi:hypothetical protein
LDFLQNTLCGECILIFNLNGSFQRVRYRFEYCLDYVMRIIAVKRFYMQRNTGVHCKGAKEFLGKTAIEVAAAPLRQIRVDYNERSPAYIQSTARKSLVHRNVKAAVSRNSFFVAYGRRKRLTKSNSYILGCVMSVNIEIAFARHLQTESRMHSERRQHVIQKSYTAVYFNLASVNIEAYRNIRLTCGSLNFSDSVNNQCHHRQI